MTATGSSSGDDGDGEKHHGDNGASIAIQASLFSSVGGGEPSSSTIGSIAPGKGGGNVENGGNVLIVSSPPSDYNAQHPDSKEAGDIAQGCNISPTSTPLFEPQETILEGPIVFPDIDSSKVSLVDKAELTVIDGPLVGSEKFDKPCAVVGGIASYHTPTSSLGSSLGEIMGESSSAMMLHDNVSPTLTTTTPDGGSTSKFMLELVSTEQPREQNHHHQQDQLSSFEGGGGGGNDDDATPDNNTMHITTNATDKFDATSATPLRGKPTLKHSIPTPADNTSTATTTSSAAPPPSRSPQPAKSSLRIQSNSSHDNTDGDVHPIDERDVVDIHNDDDENDIPAHIKSKIVEKSPAERYIRFNEKLGSGAYKDVYRAYDTIEGIEVAWNVVKLSGVPKAERIRIVNEVRLLERLHHPNIISFHGSWVNRETERVIFVTEILSSGTLKSFVQKVQLIRWKIFKRWAIQILNGLEYLHSQDPPIIHRDLKCDNIFINGTSGDLRIGDFGLSTAINQKNQVRMDCA